MSKRDYTSRHMLILKRLKAKPFSSFEDILKYFKQQEQQLRLLDDALDLNIHKRTFQRDIREMKTLHGIDIVYDRKRKGYHIADSSYDSTGFERMMEAFDTFNVLRINQNIAPHISFERRAPNGSGHIHLLLRAIQDKLKAEVVYQKYDGESAKNLILHPYHLKEFKNRWYLLAIAEPYGLIRTFALDRITELSLSKHHFIAKADIKPNTLFNDAFGIIKSDDEPAHQVILSFTPFQGKYIKSLPMHHSQQILIDDEKELQISLRLQLTYDFIMELRSYGEAVTILEPHELRERLKGSFQTALKNYE